MKLIFAIILILTVYSMSKRLEYPYEMPSSYMDFSGALSDRYDWDFLNSLEDDAMKVADILASAFPDELTQSWYRFIAYDELMEISKYLWPSVTAKHGTNILCLYTAIMDIVCSTQIIALAQDSTYILHANIYNAINLDKENWGVDLKIPHDSFARLLINFDVTYSPDPYSDPISTGKAISVAGFPGVYMASVNEDKTFRTASVGANLKSIYAETISNFLLAVRLGYTNLGTWWLRQEMFTNWFDSDPCSNVMQTITFNTDYHFACTFDDGTQSQIVRPGPGTEYNHLIGDGQSSVAAVAGYPYEGEYTRDGCATPGDTVPCDAPPSYLMYDPLSFVFDNLEGRGSSKNTPEYISNFIFESYPVRIGLSGGSVSMDANDTYAMIQKCRELSDGDVVESCNNFIPAFDWGIFILSMVLSLFIVFIWIWGAKYNETWEKEYDTELAKNNGTPDLDFHLSPGWYKKWLYVLSFGVIYTIYVITYIGVGFEVELGADEAHCDRIDMSTQCLLIQASSILYFYPISLVIWFCCLLLKDSSISENLTHTIRDLDDYGFGVIYTIYVITYIGVGFEVELGADEAHCDRIDMSTQCLLIQASSILYFYPISLVIWFWGAKYNETWEKEYDTELAKNNGTPDLDFHLSPGWYKKWLYVLSFGVIYTIYVITYIGVGFEVELGADEAHCDRIDMSTQCLLIQASSILYFYPISLVIWFCCLLLKDSSISEVFYYFFPVPLGVIEFDPYHQGFGRLWFLFFVFIARSAILTINWLVWWLSGLFSNSLECLKQPIISSKRRSDHGSCGYFWKNLLEFNIIPSLLCYSLSLPTWVFIDDDQLISTSDIVLAIVCLSGAIFELIARIQFQRFKVNYFRRSKSIGSLTTIEHQDAGEKLEVKCDFGLWKYLPKPDALGEIVFCRARLELAANRQTAMAKRNYLRRL
ncbi:Protein of unknown function DUF1295 like protein [Aduncisulcus paluster]|uniref:Uncharacterized protein n=1 Tax=Aduncisulcus paluster TaxID=2918883 RepID=A0ABQ5KGL0_9EUKA|nr:Protein of unknown function DUF1295 like protein [Aduncisulcus paluster]